MSENKTQRFTIDSEKDGVEVPTLTQLLYKKNVVKTKGSASKEDSSRSKGGGGQREEDRSRIMTLEPTVTIERPLPDAISKYSAPKKESTQTVENQVVLSQIASNRANSSAAPIQAASAQSRRVTPAAIPFHYTPSRSSTPVDKIPPGAFAAGGIRFIASKTKLEASLVFEEEGESFTLKSIFGLNSERVPLWRRMEIPRDAFSDLLGRLEKFGFAEFSTLGSAGQGNFDRTAFRTAFQAKNGEWVSLVRVKTAKKGNAIIAFITGSSIQMHLPAFHSSILGAMAA